MTSNSSSSKAESSCSCWGSYYVTKIVWPWVSLLERDLPVSGERENLVINIGHPRHLDPPHLFLGLFTKTIPFIANNYIIKWTLLTQANEGIPAPAWGSKVDQGKYRIILFIRKIDGGWIAVAAAGVSSQLKRFSSQLLHDYRSIHSRGSTNSLMGMH